MKMSGARQRLVVVGALLLWSITLLLVRSELTANWIALGLIWNLFLASVPLFWSAAFQAALQRSRRGLAALCFALWLLFLPNAPYILTDFIHLSPRPPVPLWFVLAVLLSCAGTGTLLGYLSVVTVHRVVEHTFGKVVGWMVATGSLLLCGFGIYLGRFLRWNSWDALTRPLSLMQAIGGQFIDSGSHPHPLPVTLIFGGGLVLGYIALRVIAVSMWAEPQTKSL